MAVDAAAEEQARCCCLLPLSTSESYLHCLSLRGTSTQPPQFGVRMERDERALVVLTIFTDQYPFMFLLSVPLDEVAPRMTLSLPFFCPQLPASTLSSPTAEGLYQLGGPRCPPQSSIEGLEDIEVRLWTTLRSTQLFILLCSSAAFIKSRLYSRVSPFKSLSLSLFFF